MIRLEIIDTGKYIPLSEGMDIEWYNPFPLLNEAGYKDLTVDVKIRKEYWQYLDYVGENVSAATEKNVLIWIGDIPFREGILKISSINEDYIGCTIYLNSTAFRNILQKKLYELDWGGEKSWIWKNEYLPENSEFALLPFVNEKFAENSSETAWQINPYQNGWQWQADGNLQAWIPFPWLQTVLDGIANNMGVRKTDFFRTGDLAYIFVANMSDAAQHYNDGTWHNILDTYDLQRHVPGETLEEFLKKLAKFMGLYVEIGESLNIQPMIEILANVDYIDVSDRTIRIEKEILTREDGVRISYARENEYADVPQIADEPPHHIYIDGCVPLGRENDICIETDGDVVNMKIWKNGWKNIEEQYGILKERATYFQDYIQLGEKQKKIETGTDIVIAETIYQHNNIIESLLTKNGIDFPGITSLNMKPTQRLPLTLGFYRGIVNDWLKETDIETGKETTYDMSHPYADFWRGSDRLDMWHNQNGIWAKYWRPIWQWYSNRQWKVRATVYMTINELLSWSFMRKIKIDDMIIVPTSLKYTLEDEQYIKVVVEGVEL